MAGEGAGNLRWRHLPEGRFDADAQLRLAGFQLSPPQLPPWRDNDVLIQLAANGQTDFHANTRLDAAALAVKLGSDQFDVKLLEPVTEFWGTRPWALHVRAEGLLQSWAARLAAWLPGGKWRIAGNYVFDADTKVSAGGATHCDANAEVTNLAFLDSAGRQFNEPIIRLALGGDYDGQERRGANDEGPIGLQRPGRRRGRTVRPRPPRAMARPAARRRNWAARSITTSPG